MTAAAAATGPARILCDDVLGNVASLPPQRVEGKTADPLGLTWLDCTRRAFRKRSTSGREVGVLLPAGKTLSNGDVLYEDGASYVVVEVQPCDLWLIRTANAADMARVALELGNLHVPVEVTRGGHLLTPPDGPTEGVLRRHGANYAACRGAFAPLRATVTSRLSMAKSLTIAASSARRGARESVS